MSSITPFTLTSLATSYLGPVLLAIWAPPRGDANARAATMHSTFDHTLEFIVYTSSRQETISANPRKGASQEAEFFSHPTGSW